MANDIVFRRINGRIIPIKVKKAQETAAKLSQGAAITAVGAGVAYGAGIGRRVGQAKVFRFVDKAMRKSVMAKGLTRGTKSTAEQLYFDFAMSKNLYKKSANQLRAAKFSMKTLKRFNLGARLLGIGLVGVGIERMAKAVMGDESATKEGAATTAGILGGVGAGGFFHGLGLVGKKHWKSILKTNFWKVAKRL